MGQVVMLDGRELHSYVITPSHPPPTLDTEPRFTHPLVPMVQHTSQSTKARTHQPWSASKLSSAFTVKDGHEIHDSSSGSQCHLVTYLIPKRWPLTVGGDIILYDVMRPNKAFPQSIPCHLHFSKSALRFFLFAGLHFNSIPYPHRIWWRDPCVVIS